MYARPLVNVIFLLQASVPGNDFVLKGKIRRQRRRFEELLPRYEAAITGCGAGKGSFIEDVTHQGASHIL